MTEEDMVSELEYSDIKDAPHTEYPEEAIKAVLKELNLTDVRENTKSSDS